MLMTSSNLFTVNEFAQFAPEINTTRYDNPTISGIISQASQMVADYLEYTPLAEDIHNEVAEGHVDSSGDLIIYPQKLPIISVSGIGVTKGVNTVDLTLTANNVNKYNINYNRRHIRYPSGEASFTGDLIFTNFTSLRGIQFYTTISYRGGWEVSELPQTIKQAAILFARDIFSNQYNAMGANKLSQGAVSFEFGTSQGYKESKLITDAKRLLNPYRRV